MKMRDRQLAKRLYGRELDVLRSAFRAGRELGRAGAPQHLCGQFESRTQRKAFWTGLCVGHDEVQGA